MLSPLPLQVSRTFGDMEAKLVQYGGNPKVVVADPDIKEFRMTEDIDYIFLGCKYISLILKATEYSIICQTSM